MSEKNSDRDYLVVRITRDGRLLHNPEGSCDYTDWMTTGQYRELVDMAARWGEANAKENSTHNGA